MQLFGWWWAYPIAGLLMAPIIGKEQSDQLNPNDSRELRGSRSPPWTPSTSGSVKGLIGKGPMMAGLNSNIQTMRLPRVAAQEPGQHKRGQEQ